MRKELKFWGVFIGFLLMLLIATGCKTKQVNTTKEKQQTETKVDNESSSSNQTTVTAQEQVSESELKELLQVLASLNVNYDGKNIEDKLDILLNKTPDGTKLTFSGVGSANYSESIKYDFESFKTEILERQDSLFNQALNAVLKQNERYLNEHFVKDKEVKVTGFQPGMYLTIAGIIIALFVLWRLGKFFKII